MIKPKIKKCECGYEGFFPGKKCKRCKYAESKTRTKVKATKSKPKKKYVYKRKATGELDLFRRIWDAAIDKCEPENACPISYVYALPLGREGLSWYFSHVLPKGRYPEARLDPENIVLKTLEEHELWENHQYKLIDDPKWRHVFKLKHKLLLKYGYSIPPNEEHIR